MTPSNMTLKCPECAAPLSYSAATQKFSCGYCMGAWTLQELQVQGVDTSAAQANNSVQQGQAIAQEEQAFYTATDDSTYDVDNANLALYNCPHCGAEIITSQTTAATKCVYCGHDVVLSGSVVGEFSPEAVIPFKQTQEQATAAFMKFMHKPLTPHSFYKDVEIKKVQGVYAPFWLFNCRAVGKFSGGVAGVYSTGSGDNRRTVREWYNCYREAEVKFDAIPVDASKRIENDAMDSIEPFNMAELQPFSPMYLTGFLAERWDESAQDVYPRAEERVKNSTIDYMTDDCKTAVHASMRHKPTSYEIDATAHKEVQIPDCDAHYVMLPTWLLYCEYKSKKYLFAMNGQTGKFIGNLPISYPKLVLFATIAGIIGFLLGGFFSGLFG